MRKILTIAITAIIFSITVSAQDINAQKSSQNELVNKLIMEKDGRKAELIAAEIVAKIDADSSWSNQKAKRDMYRVQPLYAYLNAQDFDGFKMLLKRLGEVNGTERIHFAVAGYVRRLVRKGVDLDYASELIQKEREWAKMKMLQGPETTDYSRELTYALFTTDYAQLLYRKGDKKSAYEISTEAMKYNQHRKDADITNFYLTVSSDLKSSNELKKELETLLKNEMSTAEVISRLKEIYAKDKGTEAGFQEYVASLNHRQVDAKMEELRKHMIHETAPDFSLKDLNGSQVNLKDLAGKIVVLDFWATWCGPCKASFPAMQVMVNKYKNDPNVRFLFIDTYEQGANKEKNVKDYITSQKYSFQVLMDNSDEVAKKYKAINIPAKYVIDKNGNLRFKVAGFKNDADLMNELEAMINLVN